MAPGPAAAIAFPGNPRYRYGTGPYRNTFPPRILFFGSLAGYGPRTIGGRRHWLRAAARQVGHLFPRLLRRSEYNDRVKALARLHGSRVPAGLWARIVQRLLALNACIWHNWMIGAPVKRSLNAYDH
jgi:hypothetical protein